MKDHINYGSQDDLRNNLSKLAARLRATAPVLYCRQDIDIGCRVYPFIAESTARQLELLSRLLDESIEITANVCRTVFEINIILRYCLSGLSKLDNFAVQAGTDEISIYKAAISLADEATDPENVRQLNAHIEQIKQVLIRHGKTLQPERPSLFEMAKTVGLKNEYQAMYGVYSKYVHASAWLILRKREDIDLPVFRHQMHLHTQLYAADTLARLEELTNRSERPTASPNNSH